MAESARDEGEKEGKRGDSGRKGGPWSRYGWRIVGERIQKERKKEGNYARRDRQLPRNLTDRLTDSRNTRPARDVCAYSR